MTNENITTGGRPFPTGKLPMRDMSKSLPIAMLLGREAVMSGFRAMLQEFGLTDQQWRVLRALAETPNLEVVELARRCAILQPSVSRILNTLEKQDLIQRKVLQSDRRRSHISITKKGKELFQQVAPRAEALYAVIVKKFSQKKLDQLMALLHDLTEVMQQES